MKLLFRMTPEGAFYTGSEFIGGHDFPFTRSDSLFNAIVNAWNSLWGKEAGQKLIELYKNGDAPFTISSIFPAIEDIYFLPRPLSLRFKTNKSKNCEKIMKQVSWISATLYREWLQANVLPWNFECFLDPCLYADSGEMSKIKAMGLSRSLWANDNRIRNKIDPSTFKTSAYPSNQIFYARPLDLYFLVDFQKEAYREKLEAVFRLLEDEGIGGKRSVGCGAFRNFRSLPLPEGMDFIDHPMSSHFMTLSLYFPHLEDVKKGMLNGSHFSIVERQGWRHDERGLPFKPNKVRLMKEGSCFDFAQVNIVHLMDVTPSGEKGLFFHYACPFRIKAPGVQE